MPNNINSLVIDGDNIANFIKQVLENDKLTDIEFRHCDFYIDDIEKISSRKKYERIAFIECSFEKTDCLNIINTDSISFTNCLIKDYSFISEMKYLTNLTIVNGYIDARIINNLEHLVYLRLSHSDILNILSLKLAQLKYLFIDNSNILDLSFISNFPSLQLLSLSDDQIANNKELIDSIIGKIKIVRDGFLEMEVFFDE